jgi:hypothetical protein
MNNNHHKLIDAIQASGRRAVMAVTGGGSLAVSDLLTVPGSSAWLLEAIVPYSPFSLTQWLCREPEHSCSRETALAMATQALRHARKLDAGAAHPIGLSCTASLVSDRPKRGDHRAWVAAQSLTATWLFGLRLDKGHRDRLGEERLVANLLLQAAAEACGLHHSVELSLTLNDELTYESLVADHLVAAVCYGRTPLAWSLPSGAVVTDPKQLIAAVLSGSFNPLHEGHLELAAAAELRLGGNLAFEIAVVNVDKPPLDFLTIESRRRQFRERPLALTTASTFVEKSRQFPKTVFVVGIDTAERIAQPKYYGHSEAAMIAALNQIRTNGCRFLVGGRCRGNEFCTLSELELPAAAHGLFEEIPASEFRRDISSTELRQQG